MSDIQKEEVMTVGQAQEPLYLVLQWQKNLFHFQGHPQEVQLLHPEVLHQLPAIMLGKIFSAVQIFERALLY